PADQDVLVAVAQNRWLGREELVHLGAARGDPVAEAERTHVHTLPDRLARGQQVDDAGVPVVAAGDEAAPVFFQAADDDAGAGAVAAVFDRVGLGGRPSGGVTRVRGHGPDGELALQGAPGVSAPLR